MKAGDLVEYIEQTGYNDVGLLVEVLDSWPPQDSAGVPYRLVEVLWCDTGEVQEVYEDQLEAISESR